MRTKSVNVYAFTELSDAAKERAKHDYAVVLGYSWADEALESIQALAKHFGGRMSDYSIDWFGSTYSSASFDMPEDVSEDELYVTLLQLGSYDVETLRGHGDCRLTGYCMDEDAVDGFRAALHGGETDLEALMDAAFDSWLKAAQSDCEAQYSDEAFGETCDANNYEFYEDGSIA